MSVFKGLIFSIFLVNQIACMSSWDNDISVQDQVVIATDESVSLDLEVFKTTYMPFVSGGLMRVEKIKAASCDDSKVCHVKITREKWRPWASILIYGQGVGQTTLTIQAFHPYRERYETIRISVQVDEPPLKQLDIGMSVGGFDWAPRISIKSKALRCHRGSFNLDVLIKNYYPKADNLEDDLFFGCFEKVKIDKNVRRYATEAHNARWLLCVSKANMKVHGFRLWQLEEAEPNVKSRVISKGKFASKSCDLAPPS